MKGKNQNRSCQLQTPCLPYFKQAFCPIHAEPKQKVYNLSDLLHREVVNDEKMLTHAEEFAYELKSKDKEIQKLAHVYFRVTAKIIAQNSLSLSIMIKKLCP